MYVREAKPRLVATNSGLQIALSIIMKVGIVLNGMGSVSHREDSRAGCLRVALALGLVCGFLLPPAVPAAEREATRPSLFDIVAVGFGPGEILMATPVRSAGRLVWRFRKIALSPSSVTARRVVLSATGTKALVVLSDGRPRVVDLTRRVTEIGVGELQPPQHRLPGQFFPYEAGGKVCLVNDLGAPDLNSCAEATAAAVHEDGSVLYSIKDGRLIVVQPNGSQEELPYRLPAGSQWRLLAGHKGDRRDFLALVTTPPAKVKGGREGPTTEIIDPRHPATPLARYADPLVAGVQAQIEFRATAAVETERPNPDSSNNTALTALAERLKQESGRSDLTWSFYRVSPDPKLYAPVLELAPGEPDFPSDVGIWQEIRPLAHGTTREAYEKAYASLGERRWSHCTVYVRTLSYPGTWLIEYWYYYPFDEGKPHAHLHDSEHLFVEVDKLGGTVRNVFASDHDALAPNNLYSVLVKDAPPVALPLYANVELGKHAMAPDLNHDGRFTRGVDDNLHPESYAVWGLRDRGHKTGDIMEPYRAGMSIPRRPEDRLALSDAGDLFPGFPAGAAHLVCRLEPLPDSLPRDDGEGAMPAAAMAHLVDHPDARAPESIYKPYVLPWREVRLGVGIYDWSGGRGQLSAAFMGDSRHMTGGFLPLPVRLGLEYSWTPIRQAVPVHFSAQGQYLLSKSTMYAGLRLERLVTHTQGLYFALTPEWVDITARAMNGVPTPAGLHWQYDGVSYHAGYLIELPSAHWCNFTNQIGVVIRNAPAYRVLFEWRVSFGFWRQRGRHGFGARPGDRNPYE